MGTFLLSTDAISSDLEKLAKKGFGVVESTAVDGEFEGCDFDRRIKLINGLVFVCSSYNYSYGYMPEVLILKSVRNGELRVMINDDEMDGTLYRTH